MSRTYRHILEYKNKKAWEKYYENWDWRCGRGVLSERERPKTLPWEHHLYCRNPSWWNHIYNEIPFRRHNKKLCRQVLKGQEEVDFRQTHRKPYMYYW